jgi:hypothetical protein
VRLDLQWGQPPNSTFWFGQMGKLPTKRVEKPNPLPLSASCRSFSVSVSYRS